MIAIFTNRIDILNREITLSDTDSFRVVTDIHKIRGINFTGIILHYDWYANDNTVNAYESLKLRQPELFKFKH